MESEGLVILKHKHIDSNEAIIELLKNYDINQLKRLSLLRNFLTNSVVSLTFNGQFSSLTELYLGANELTAFPDLSSLPNLLVLHLNNNKILDLAHSDSVSKLKELNLRGNRIQTLSLFEYQHLEWLSLSSNMIETLEAMPCLPSVKYLGLFGNYLGKASQSSETLQSTLLSIKKNCPRIEELLLSGNYFELNPNYQALVTSTLSLKKFDIN